MLFYQLLSLAAISFVAIALPIPPQAITIHHQVLNSRASFEPENKAPSTIIIPKDLAPRSWVDDLLKVIQLDNLPLVSSLTLW